MHCWKYVKGTQDLHLKIWPNLRLSNSLQHYTDATWADYVVTCISWKSTEAELNALADGVQESQWIKLLVEEICNEDLQPSTFHIKKQGLAKKNKAFWFKLKDQTS